MPSKQSGKRAAAAESSESAYSSEEDEEIVSGSSGSNVKNTEIGQIIHFCLSAHSKKGSIKLEDLRKFKVIDDLTSKKSNQRRSQGGGGELY